MLNQPGPEMPEASHFAGLESMSATTLLYRRAQTELGTFFSILYLSPSKERRSVELLDLLYFIKRLSLKEVSVYFTQNAFRFIFY